MNNTFVGNVVEQPTHRIPGCAVSASYSLLHCLKRDVKLSEVSLAFECTSTNYDPLKVSIAAVRTVLREYGVQSQAYRIPPSRLARIETPCILYMRPGRWGRSKDRSQTGHFMTLVGFNGERAIILDWSGMSFTPPAHLPIRDLVAAWDGEYIAPERMLATNRWLISFLSLAVVLAFCICATKKSRCPVQISFDRDTQVLNP